MTTKPDILKKAQNVAQQCYLTRIRTLDRMMTRVYNEAFAETDMTSSQFALLTAILLMGETTGAKLSAVLQIEKSTLSRNLKLMEKNGWIKAQDEGRSTLLCATPEGTTLYENLFPLWAETQEKVRQLLGANGTEYLDLSINALKGEVL